MGVATKFLETVFDSKKQETLTTMVGLIRGIIRLIRPQHPLVGALTAVMAAVTVADDAVVDAMLARKLRDLKSRLETAANDIQRQQLERRIAAIAAAITE